MFPAIVDDRPPGSVVRIWVAGCSTGEEVYSLAISLLEYLDGRPENVLDQDPGDRPERAGAGKGPRRRLPRQYRDRRLARRGCGGSSSGTTATIRSANLSASSAFSHGTTLRNDPPFSRLDLISCRNVLIYMDTALQKRVIPLLHYALNPEGLPVPGLVGERWRLGRPVRAGRCAAPDFRPDCGDGVGCRSTSARSPGGGHDAARAGSRRRRRRCGTPWTFRKRPTGCSFPATPRSAWWWTRR